MNLPFDLSLPVSLPLPVTLGTAGLLGLVYLVLALRIVFGRFRMRISLGDGGQGVMLRRIRAHGNFAEYVPLLLLFMALFELAGDRRGVLVAGGALLVLARISHAIGIEIPKAPNPFRAFGSSVTFLLLLAASVRALVLAIKHLD